ncbi:MAG: MBL fold metallo-hydrolase [Bacteroidetes bacterium]|nr:MBL fold metallo-hydrolase [Bacteroidota bacterium]
MITLKRFAFNPFQVNTYILSDETGECVIIDAGMQGQREEDALEEYINNHNLKPVMLILTHAHIDHIIGNSFVADKYKLKLTAHKDCVPFLKNASAHAANFGLTLDNVKEIDDFVDEDSEIKFGNSTLKVLFTPGHANGSVCFYSPKDKFVITGDVLFNQSIGRTDLPTGDYDLLQKSIWEKLFTLPDETVAYPGHGPETTIGSEKVNNPFVAIGR